MNIEEIKTLILCYGQECVLYGQMRELYAGAERNPAYSQLVIAPLNEAKRNLDILEEELFEEFDKINKLLRELDTISDEFNFIAEGETK